MEGKPKHWSEERAERGQAPTPQQFTDAQLTKMRTNPEEAARYAEVPESVKVHLPEAGELSDGVPPVKPMPAPAAVPAPAHKEEPPKPKPVGPSELPAAAPGTEKKTGR